MLSILIPTLASRRRQFEELTRKLREQIEASPFRNQVEVIHLLDDREHTVGAKRNWLLDQARGEFVAFVDDDDEVSDRYVMLVCGAIQEHPDIDCVGVRGIISFRGRGARTFVHSLQYRRYCRQGKTFCRPPYHLNPMRRAVACRYRFEDISYSEDIDWAMRICRDRALQREFFVEEVLYYYHSRRHRFYQWLLDRTESVRHLLGLQLVNRIRFQRWLQARLGRSDVRRRESRCEGRCRAGGEEGPARPADSEPLPFRRRPNAAVPALRVGPFPLPGIVPAGESAGSSLLPRPVRTARLLLGTDQGAPGHSPGGDLTPMNVQEKVLILTPVKDAVPHLDTYFRALAGLSHPPTLLSLGFLESDSRDATYAELERRLPELRGGFRTVGLWKKDFGYCIPPRTPRWASEIQVQRRAVLARSRNHLLFRALDDEDWVLWLDVDVIEYPRDILERLLATGRDIVQPNCVKEYGGKSFDLNAWRDEGRLYLHDLREEGDLVPLHAVGGTMLLIRADLHRDGLVFPPYLYGKENPRIRPERDVNTRKWWWSRPAAKVVGEIETEGLGMMAHDMGHECWGMPNLEIKHKNA
jgi:glycosyltransferase involved in cell wall biosynthesis